MYKYVQIFVAFVQFRENECKNTFKISNLVVARLQIRVSQLSSDNIMMTSYYDNIMMTFGCYKF